MSYLPFGIRFHLQLFNQHVVSLVYLLMQPIRLCQFFKFFLSSSTSLMMLGIKLLFFSFLTRQNLHTEMKTFLNTKSCPPREAASEWLSINHLR